MALRWWIKKNYVVELVMLSVFITQAEVFAQ
jgi:hypothetical protein